MAEQSHSTLQRGLSKTATGIPGRGEITGGGLPSSRPPRVCGSAGRGKALIAVEFPIRGATASGEPGVLISSEESAEGIAENVRSPGFNLDELQSEGKIRMDHVHARVERSEIDETGEVDREGLFIRLGFAIDSVAARRVVLDTPEALFSGLDNMGILRAKPRWSRLVAGSSSASRARSNASACFSTTR